MIVRTEDVVRLTAEIPDGHLHLRTTLFLADGNEIVLQEATVAAIVRSYVSVKTHPLRTRVVLTGQRRPDKKEGFAEWQLIEEE